MKALFYLILVSCLTLSACKRRKAATAPEAAPSPAASEPTTSGVPNATSAPTAPPVNVAHLQTSPEFADLNNLVSWFYDRNKRLPTLPELAKMSGKPLPNPPGYKLAIDPKTKTVKAVP